MQKITAFSINIGGRGEDLNVHGAEILTLVPTERVVMCTIRGWGGGLTKGGRSGVDVEPRAVRRKTGGKEGRNRRGVCRFSTTVGENENIKEVTPETAEQCRTRNKKNSMRYLMVRARRSEFERGKIL